MATPVQYAVDGHFAPFVRLTLSTLVLAVGAMFMLATTRTASAFADPHSYLGRFVNREFFADYSPASTLTTHVLSLTLNPEDGTGAADVRTVQVNGFTELRPQIVDAARADGEATFGGPGERRAARGDGTQGDARAPHSENSADAATDRKADDAPTNRADRAAAVAQTAVSDADDTDEPATDSSARRTSGPPGPEATLSAIVPGPHADRSDTHPAEATPRPTTRQPRATPSPEADSTAPVPTVAPNRRAEPSPVPDAAPTSQPTAAPRGTDVPVEPRTTSIPTAGTPGEPGVLDRVPTIVSTAIPVLPTPIPVVPTTAPTRSSTGGSASPTPTEKPKSGTLGGGILNPLPTLVPIHTLVPLPTVPPLPLPTLGTLLIRL